MKYGKPTLWDRLKRISTRILRAFRPVVYAKWEKYIDKTYILNLPSRTDRKKRLIKHLKLVKTGKNTTVADHVTWWPAFGGLKTYPETCHLPKYPFYWHWLIDPNPKFLKKMDHYFDIEIECSTAESNISCGHVLMWRDFVASKKETALFMEDDVLFEHDFEERFNKIMKKELPEDWDMLYWSGLPSKHGFVWDPHSEHLVKLHMGMWWMSGYMLSRKGAQKLIDNLPVVGPVDVWINHQFKKMNTYCCKWSLIDQGGDDTSDNTYSFEERFFRYNDDRQRVND